MGCGTCICRRVQLYREADHTLGRHRLPHPCSGHIGTGCLCVRVCVMYVCVLCVCVLCVCVCMCVCACVCACVYACV